MPTASTPEFATHLSVDEARCQARQLGAQRPTETESAALEDALDRFLAGNLLAPHDLPPFANSAMDGYALRGAELPVDGERRFRLAGVLLAGAGAAPRFAAGECVRITTGAALPEGADTVVIKENARVEGDWIVVGAGARAGANTRQAGEDYRAGDLALKAGDRLTPARLGVLAACGHACARVARRPRVALFVTGDELVAPDGRLGFGQIHDSNRYSVGGMLLGLGIAAEPVAHLRDDPDALRIALHEAAGRCDMVITSGGVSAGEADFLPGLVAELGTVHFWKVRMKPGMPVLCGEIDGCLVFALPGNPVSTIATFVSLVRPALLAMQGANDADHRVWKARLAVPILKKHDRTEFMRVHLDVRDDAVWWATPLPAQGSGMLSGLAGADALIIVAEGTHALEAGAVVEVMPLPGLC